METATSVCPKCALPVLANFYFCPNCGKQLRIKAIELSVGKIIGLCLLSFFLPPFGVYPAIKYIRQTNPQTKIVGFIAIGLTVVAYVIAISSFISIMQQFSNVYGTLLQ